MSDLRWQVYSAYQCVPHSRTSMPHEGLGPDLQTGRPAGRMLSNDIKYMWALSSSEQSLRTDLLLVLPLDKYRNELLGDL